MTEKQITKQYNKLVNDAAKNPVPADRFNCYTCACGHITKTVDATSGVTPLFFPCVKCGASASSSFYEDLRPDSPAEVEWYRPSLEKVLWLKDRNEPLLEHILMGGLEYRFLNPYREIQVADITSDAINYILNELYRGSDTPVKDRAVFVQISKENFERLKEVLKNEIVVEFTNEGTFEYHCVCGKFRVIVDSDLIGPITYFTRNFQK